ncbi:MAG: hypothetical protein AAGE01_07020 [Pseudomonadota bacterium]
MHPVAERLLQQHVEFELEALTGKDLQPWLRAEVRHGFELAETLTLGDCVTEKRCKAAFKRLLVSASIPSTVWESGVSLFLCFAQRLEESKIDLQAVIGQERFAELVLVATSIHEPRRRLIAEMFNHPLYAELISSLVYQALLNYLIEDNLISQRVPGVGSMLKLGRKVATTALPSLDATVERRLKNYIKSYLPSLIKTSEQFVDDVVTDEELADHVAEAWAELGPRQLSGLIEGLEPEDAERVGEWGQGYWDELRRSDSFTDLGETLIAQFFEWYGDEPLAVLLEDFGITRTMVTKELGAFAPPLLKRLHQAGYLEDVLRRRLTPFYESAAVTATFESTVAS